MNEIRRMSSTDYTKYNLIELQQLCKQRGLKGIFGIKKKFLIELLNSTSSSTILENDFVFQPMITYIGNKRKLIPWIMEIIQQLQHNLGTSKLIIFDAFAGSGVVSRAFIPFCSELYCNDIEYYSYILLRCFLEKPSDEQKNRINKHFEVMNKISSNPTHSGFVTKLYSPKSTNKPLSNERCFYTHENAMIIDSLLEYIFSVETDIKHYLLGPLIIKSSINVNTAGVFRGFYKKDGIGHFGGSGENALERILAPITLTTPIWSSFNCKTYCFNSDINKLITSFSNNTFDIIYLDPPYNEHPYGSNYFMLNLIAKNESPTEYSKVSGIPKEWNKSLYNGRNTVYQTMFDLIEICLQKTKYIVLSYNNEGLITENDWNTIFITLKCNVVKHEKEYDTYHGSRNLSSRNKKVTEILYVISK